MLLKVWDLRDLMFFIDIVRIEVEVRNTLVAEEMEVKYYECYWDNMNW